MTTIVRVGADSREDAEGVTEQMIEAAQIALLFICMWAVMGPLEAS